MPWIPMYLAVDDVAPLSAMLNADEEIAFIVTDGPKRWKAILGLATLPMGPMGMWHIPSGPLPLLAPEEKDDGWVHDPLSGWNELRTRADPTTPYFGPGHPGVIWLDLCVFPKEQNSACGMSSIEWIGNHYRLIGNPAMKTTELWWRSLRRRIQRIAKKVPRQTLSSSWSRPEIFAFPAALVLLEAGKQFDANPH
jgi:hypothetical protein